MLQSFFKYFFSKFALPESLAKQSNLENSIIVAQSASLINQALLQSYAEKLNLTIYRLGETAPKNGLCWCILDDLQSKPTTEIEQHKPENSIQYFPQQKSFITQNVFFRKGPMYNVPHYKLYLYEELGLFFLKPWISVIFSNPQEISQNCSAQRLRRQIKLNFYQNLKMVRGTPFQNRQTQARIILSGSDYERETKIIAQRLGLTKLQIDKAARKSFFEMAASPSRPIYALLAFIAQIIIKRLFTNLEIRNLERFVNTAKQYPTVLVPAHRSHMDYIILSKALYDANINPPLVAAGINLNFWPVGYFLRSVGAFFIKRSSKGDRIHSMVLKHYITYLTKRGHLQEFFIEGTRSRSGKMLPPKFGLLRIIVNAYLKGIRNEILFVPVSISYENVVEDKIYGQENTGKTKIKENFFSLLKAKNIFKSQYGDVIINFAEPISLSAYFKSSDTDIKSKLNNLGLTLTHKIRDQYLVSLTNLSYTAIMMAPKYALSQNQLLKQVHNLANYLLLLKKSAFPISDFTPSLNKFLTGSDMMLADLTRGGLIKSEKYLDETIYYIAGNQRYTADFYRNGCAHMFVPLSMLSIVSLTDRGLSLIEDLHRLFQLDFLLEDKAAYLAQIKNLCELLQEKKMLEINQDKIKFTNQEIFIPSILLSTIQSHLWVYSNLSKHAVFSTIKHDQFIAELQERFKVALYMGLVSRTESASKANLITTLDSLSNQRVINISDNKEEIKLLKDVNADLILLKEINYKILTYANSLLNLP